jgi:flagellar biosynthesis/type III secretory pathway M-ring protein FliF/YscJ
MTPTGGLAGSTANAGADKDNPNTNAVAAAPVNGNHTRKKTTTSSYEINKNTSNVIEGAGGIKRLSTAVFVAEKFEGKGADRKAVPRTPEELEKLRHIVQDALGIQQNSDTDRKDELVLEEMPFNDQVATDLTQQLDQQEKKQFWMDSAQKMIYPAMAVGILFMFWRALKQTKVDDIPIGIPIGNGHTNGNGNGNGKHGKGIVGEGVVTVEVLNQLIRENPANMSQAVRTWLTRGKPSN